MNKQKKTKKKVINLLLCAQAFHRFNVVSLLLYVLLPFVVVVGVFVTPQNAFKMSGVKKVSKADLYTLVIHQLLEDGFEQAAHVVASAVQLAPTMVAGQQIAPDRLATLVEAGFHHEQANLSHGSLSTTTTNASTTSGGDSLPSVLSGDVVDAEPLFVPSLGGIDFDVKDETVPRVRRVAFCFASPHF